MLHSKQLKKITKQLFFLTGLMLLVIVPLVWLGIKNPNQIQNLEHIVSQNKLFFTSLRWLIILAIFSAWPRFIRRRAKHRYWKPEKTMFWLNQRLKITFWLIIFEVLICENLLLTLIRFLEGH